MTMTMLAQTDIDRRVRDQPLRAGTLDRALAFGDWLIGSVETLARQFDLADAGSIDLPPVSGSAADQSQLRIAAPLYLACELEFAQLVPAVETLTGLFVSGGLQADIGPAAPLVAQFWQTRQQRFSADERRALFAQLFGESFGPSLAADRSGRGGGRNTSFELLLIDLAEALYKFDPRSPGLFSLSHTLDYASELAIRTAAQQLAANLIPRCGGLALFAARELLDTIKQALAIVQVPAIQRVVGATSAWTAVQNVAQRYLDQSVDTGSRVTRAKSGEVLLAWLAEVLPRLDDIQPEPLVDLRHPVIRAAAAWLQASLTLRGSAPEPYHTSN